MYGTYVRLHQNPFRSASPVQKSIFWYASEYFVNLHICTNQWKYNSFREIVFTSSGLWQFFLQYRTVWIWIQKEIKQIRNLNTSQRMKFTHLLGGGDVELSQLSLQIRIHLQVQESLRTRHIKIKYAKCYQETCRRPVFRSRSRKNLFFVSILKASEGQSRIWIRNLVYRSQGADFLPPPPLYV
jgi:hypothetical protein